MEFHSNSIETFLAIVRAQTISGAAGELHVAQTTVSQRIKVLEKEFGIRLFERGKGIKKIILTPMGEEFYKLAEEWMRIEQEANLLRIQGPRLSLNVGTVNSFNALIIPTVVTDLISNKTPLKLQIYTSHSDQLYSEIEKRHLDVGYSLKERIHPNVTVEKFFTSPMVVLQSSNVSEYSDEHLHPRDLDPDYELFMPWGLEYQSWHDYWWSSSISSQVKLDSTHLLLHLLKESLYWAIVPKSLADLALENGTFKVSGLSYPPPDYTVYRLTHVKQSSLKKKSIEIWNKTFSTYF
ncbi:hypothetical protein CHH49_05690 [Terribacillus saccharophilus]|uniref:LysR family transcriptional regulator n=1 Tax=Terribacillus saccharophilus TaxID=361277 RepID=UPI000BA59BCF|nr:LysR family transcriptional regulator [Terribacillus saccharophilus]PAF22107.1 hypothetical protein CHH49_05690 [Terribacillus saccharophilus]